MEGETKLYHELISVADPGLCYGHLLVVPQFLKNILACLEVWLFSATIHPALHTSVEVVFKVASIPLPVMSVTTTISSISVVAPLSPLPSPAVLVLLPGTPLPPLVPPLSARPSVILVMSVTSMSEFTVTMTLFIAIISSPDVFSERSGQWVVGRLVYLASSSYTKIASGAHGLGINPTV